MKLKKFAGFSLMEMMVVLLIVAVVMAASAPLISRKMMRTSGAGGGTDNGAWTILWPTRNITYNWNGAGDQTAMIGTQTVSGNHPRLQIAGNSTNRHIELQNGTNSINMFLNNNAFGITNNSLGSKATAVGASSNAGGTNSTAVGASSKANTTDTTAYGYNAQATAANATAIGSGANATATSATSVGGGATATAANAIAVGRGAIASVANTTAVGASSNAAGANATAYGYNAQATKDHTVAIGDQVLAAANNSVAIGYDSVASDNSAIAIGSQVRTNRPCMISIGHFSGNSSLYPTDISYTYSKWITSVAIGDYVNAALGGIAMGTNASAEAQQTVAIGHATRALNKGATAIGAKAYANGNYALAIGGGYFEESGSSGWGNDVVMPANDMTQTTLEGEPPSVTFYPKGDKLAFLKNSFASSGKASWFGLCNPAYAASQSYYTSVANSAGAISIGSAVNASSNRAIAIGTKVDAAAANAIAIGASSNASGQGSIAIGCKVGTYYEHYANKIHAIAIGSASIAGGNYAIALGPNAHAAKNHSVAVGLNAEANTTAVAIGKKASAGGTNSIALGTNATASHTRSVAIGYNAATTAANQIVLGDANTTVNIPGNIVWKDKIITFGDTAITQEGHRGRYVQSWESSVNPHPSDRRLKNVGEVFKGGLAELKKLEFFHYTYKEDKSKTPHVGVIAQDLQKVFPDAVIKGDDGFLRIRLEDMFYAVINAVKELDTRLTALSTQVKSNVDLTAKLQQKINTQEKQIAELKKQNAEFEKRLAKLEKKTK